MKKILIVSRRLTRKNKLINWVSEIYLKLIAENGIMPIIVPIADETPKILASYLKDYNGLLMVEGGDVGPQYYNENYNTQDLDEYDPLKDEIEIECCNHALSKGKPILGLCRGMHIINAMLGGTIHKDVHEVNQNKVLHVNYDNYDNHRHKIKILENTLLQSWYKEEFINVNTYHHQGIKKLAPMLNPMAVADDGLIEGVHHPDHPFLVGLQFHPERMYDEYMGNKKVFAEFFKAVRTVIS